MTGIGWRNLQKERGRMRLHPAPTRVSRETHHPTSLPRPVVDMEGLTMQAICLIVAGATWGVAVGIIIAGLLR